MNINLIFIIFFLIGAVICSSINNNGQKKVYIIWCTFLLLLSVSFKSAYYGITSGGDTYRYIEKFKDVIEMNFGEIWQLFVDRYFHGIGDYDIGYVLLEWFVGRVTDSYHIFNTLVILLFFVPFAKVINRYTDSIIEVFFAYLLYAAIFHNLALYGARQVYAMGFGLMFFMYYSDHKYKDAAIALLVGVTMHMSLLLVLIPFLLSFLPHKTLKILPIVTILLVPIVLVSANTVIYFMGDFIGSEKYASYGMNDVQGGAITYILLSELLSILCIILNKEDNFEDEQFKYIYSMVPVFTFFAPLIYSNGSMMRITAYSQIFVSVLIPYLLKNRFGYKSKYFLVIMIIALSALMLKGGYIPYEFFWKSDPTNLW